MSGADAVLDVVDGSLAVVLAVLEVLPLVP